MKIPYNPDILKWAREYINYSIEDIADKLKKDVKTIENWENGKESPTYIQLEYLAYNVYKKPIALFFFPNKPKLDYIEKSFRTIAEYEIKQLNPKFKLLIDKAISYQLNIKELTDNTNMYQNNILENLQFDSFMSTEEMTKLLRNFINTSISEQEKWKNPAIALKQWINKLENIGIYIFKEAFKNDDYSGFCLYDNETPIIYLNSSKSKTRQIFTLFHELAHLLFKTSGINSRNHIEYYKGIEETIEIHCNKFAGIFLIPNEDFLGRIKNLEINEDNIKRLSNIYSVSKEAVLRKYLDLGEVTQSYYQRKREEWNKIAIKSKENKKGQFYYNINSYLSNSYKSIVFGKYLKNELSVEQTANYFNIKTNQIPIILDLYLKSGV